MAEMTANTKFPDAPTLTPEELLSVYAKDHELNTVFFVVLLLELILGTSGNVLVIAAILINKKLRKVQYVFVLNLAVADLFISACLNGMNLVSINTHGSYLMSSFHCEIIGFLCTVSCATSIFSLAAIALNRYIAICHHLIYPTIYSKRIIPLLVAFTWLIGISEEVTSRVLRSDVNLIIPELFICGSSLLLGLRPASIGQLVTFWLVGYGLPISLIIFCYLRIWLYTQASKKTLRNISGDGSSQCRFLTNTDRRLLRSLFTLVVAVILLVVPFCTIFIFRLSVSRAVFVATFTLYHLNSCINCFLYALINRDFRRGYQDVFRRCRLVLLSAVCNWRKYLRNSDV